MAKINIEFDGKIYSVDENTLAPLASPLERALIQQLAGTGAVIRLGNTNYNVDANKLASARNVLTGHFSAVAGTDSKVTVNGTVYGLSKAKLQGATDKMTGTLGGMAVKASEGLEYELNDDDVSYSVIGIGTCADTDIVIPSTYEGLPVTRLKSKVEYYEEKGNITSITTGPFQNNTNITSVYIPNNITTIDSNAFYGCTSLTGVYITDIAKWCSINFGAIENAYNCANPLFYAKNLYLNENLITELVIPNGVISIKDYAFHGCNFLSISIPNSVNTIGKHTFTDCNGLMDIYVNTPEDFVKGAFWGAPFAEVHWNSTGPEDEPIEPETPDEPSGTLDLEFELNEDGASYSVIGIGTCTDADIIIPAIYEGLPVTQLKAQTEWVEIKGEMIKTYKGTFEDNTSLSSIYIPSSVTNIDIRTFSGCTGLTSVTMGDGVTNIGDSAFFNCTRLTSIVLSKNLRSIGDHVFQYCTNLRDITIPERVACIGEYAFYGCDNLSSINIPYNLRRVDSYAFNRISDVHITNITRWCSIDFSNSSSNPLNKNLYLNGNLLSDLVIPDTVTEIKDYAFRNCECLKSITIPDSVTSIGYDAFYGCILRGVYYDGDIASWCNISFSNMGANPVDCTGGDQFYIKKLETNEYELLTNFVIPDSVTEIKDYAFYRFHCLKSVTIPNSVTSIGDEAFLLCIRLANIVIPESVTQLGYWAFAECMALTDIVFDGTMEQWNNISKDGYWNYKVPADYVQCTDGQVTL